MSGAFVNSIRIMQVFTEKDQADVSGAVVL